MVKVVMTLASCKPTAAKIEQTKSRPTGESLSVFSMKCAQNRNANMIADVHRKRALPCSDVKRLPVMF